jgi:hypothetical protein
MNFTSKIKNGIICGFVSGFFIGCVPNKLSIRFEDKKYNSLPIPLISGIIGSMGIIFSPLLMVNYFCNGVYFDKLVDNYDINVERHHQYNGQNNKYAYPSSLIINIKSKSDSDTDNQNGLIVRSRLILHTQEN